MSLRYIPKCKYENELSWEVGEDPDNWIPSLKAEYLEASFPWTEGHTQDRDPFSPWYEAEETPEEAEAEEAEAEEPEAEEAVAEEPEAEEAEADAEEAEEAEADSEAEGSKES